MADDRKTRKTPGSVSLVDMERQFQDDDALARAINSALMDADVAISRTRERTPAPTPADESIDLPLAFATEEFQAVDDSGAHAAELELPAEEEPPPLRAPVPQPAVSPSRPEGLALVEEAPEARLEPPERVRNGAVSKEESDTYERLLRVMAEFDNYKKRMVREQEEFRRFAHEKLVLGFLPAMDNIERAIVHSETANDVKVLLDGVKMIQRQLKDIFLKAGVRGFDSLGQRFDPSKHQAMQTRASAEVEPGHVLEEFQRGYFLHDRLIRPALVVVAERGSSETEALPDLPTLDEGAALGAVEGEVIEDLEPLEEVGHDTEVVEIIEELEPVEESGQETPR